MPKLKILIVEDNFIIAEDLKNILTDLGYNVVDIVMSYYEAIECIINKQPDLCLLDIVIKGEKDGIDLAHTINQDFGLPFLFITSHSDKHTVERAKSTLPKGYIIKPFDQDDVYASVEMAAALAVGIKNQKPSILIRQNGILNRVFVHDISFVKSDKNYLEVFTMQGQKYILRQALKEFLDQIHMADFCQIHKSYAVHIKHVSSFNAEGITINNEQIPIGKKYYNELKARCNAEQV
jgi:two-component system, LytTR family, response regulator LytT